MIFEKIRERLQKKRQSYMDEYGMIDIKIQEVFVEIRNLINQVEAEYKDINIITDYLQYVRDNADNYDTENGWSLADLIDLSIKFSEVAEYNNGWIPCSERLPETYGDYLCCDNYGEYIIGFPNKRDSNDDDYVEYYVETEHEIMNDCIAWQPLPDPYIPKAEPEWQDRMMNHFIKGE